ncbi:MAG: DUF6883 domain-containing protein [Limisphaerales bacterium]
MRLPNASAASAPERKITDYLLNPGHPAGGSKAGFFLKHGFKAEEWQKLADAMLLIGRENEVVLAEKPLTAAGSSWTAG